MKDIALPIAPVDVVEVEALGISLDTLFQSRPQGDQVVDRLIGLEQAVVLDALQFLDGGLDILLAEEELAAFVVDAVESLQLLAQNPFQKHIAGLPLPLGKGLFGWEVFVAQVDEELQGGELGEIFFVEAETGHDFLLAWLRVR